MFSRFALCMVVILFGASVAQEAVAQVKLQDALLAQERKLIDAINKKDKAAIGALLADERMSVTSRGVQTTAEIVRALDGLSFSKYAIEEPTTMELGREAAILTYKFSWTGGATGQPAATTTVQATSVWRLINGQWRSVFYQETALAK